jgi:hypothetical protein
VRLLVLLKTDSIRITTENFDVDKKKDVLISGQFEYITQKINANQMPHKSTDLSQNYEMMTISSADIVWKRAVCVANKRE